MDSLKSTLDGAKAELERIRVSRGSERCCQLLRGLALSLR
jgi:hypothetical protein